MNKQTKAKKLTNRFFNQIINVTKSEIKTLSKLTCNISTSLSQSIFNGRVMDFPLGLVTKDVKLEHGPQLKPQTTGRTSSVGTRRICRKLKEILIKWEQILHLYSLRQRKRSQIKKWQSIKWAQLLIIFKFVQRYQFYNLVLAVTNKGLYFRVPIFRYLCW